MRVLISVDMEGIAGIADPGDVRPGHSEYERNRTLITGEASAAVRGAPRFDGPVLLEVDVLCPGMTERPMLIPGIELAGPRTLRYAAADYPMAYRVIQLITLLAGI